MEAKTIHRLLEVKPPEGYQKNEENPLRGDVLIVDECSMIDIMLMYHLLKAVPDTMTLILVGDVDQLPSVGAGNVLRDIIDSGTVSVMRLTRIFRQAQQSAIVMGAHQGNQGILPPLTNQAGRKDFFFLRRLQGEQAVQTIVELCNTRLPRNLGISSDQIQVLSPTRRYVTGTANLNRELQAALNPPAPDKGEVKVGSVVFRTGDRVMQIRNNDDIMWR